MPIEEQETPEESQQAPRVYPKLHQLLDHRQFPGEDRPIR